MGYFSRGRKDVKEGEDLGVSDEVLSFMGASCLGFGNTAVLIILCFFSLIH